MTLLYSVVYPGRTTLCYPRATASRQGDRHRSPGDGAPGWRSGHRAGEGGRGTVLADVCKYSRYTDSAPDPAESARRHARSHSGAVCIQRSLRLDGTHHAHIVPTQRGMRQAGAVAHPHITPHHALRQWESWTPWPPWRARRSRVGGEIAARAGY